eukprot:120543-Pelagomonas_calceolata.AAC.1
MGVKSSMSTSYMSSACLPGGHCSNAGLVCRICPSATFWLGTDRLHCRQGVIKDELLRFLIFIKNMPLCNSLIRHWLSALHSRHSRQGCPVFRFCLCATSWLGTDHLHCRQGITKGKETSALTAHSCPTSGH